ncbi:MAG: pyridoxamine 5'-phosphate oxidase family protein [Pseudomonadota bacterium]
MAEPSSPFRPVDDEARSLASTLLQENHAALAVLDPSGAPSVTRIAFLWLDGAAHSLISTLSDHTQALDADPRCSLLLGVPGAKGDPLTHPRLTLAATAQVADKAAMRDAYLTHRPKAQIYFDFTDFRVIRFDIQHGLLNGGFGKAFRLTPEDLA